MTNVTDLKVVKDVNTEAVNELAAFAAAANQNLRSEFAGQLLTCKKGKWSYGKEKTELALGTELVAVMSEARHGFVKWQSGKIAGSEIKRILDCPMLSRRELGDLNEDNWPVSNMTGKQEDPWQKTIYLPLVTPEGDTIFNFTTHPTGASMPFMNY
jgi:hypothetical protein